MKDGFGRTIDYMRVSLTDRCNYRCLYCMKETGVEKKSHDEILSLEDMYSVIRAFAGLGGEKVRFTGGEPLVRKNAVGLIERVGKLGLKKIGLTTNGVYLPEYVDRLKDAGVTAINVSIDSFDEEKYRYVTVGGELTQAKAGLRSALEAGIPEIKLNAVLLKGINEEEVESFADFGRENGIAVRFIEVMPFAANASYEKYGLRADEVIEKYGLSFVRQEGNAEYYAFPDGKEVGFIRPLSHKFCSSCNRLRLTSDGKLLPCLHGNTEIDVREYLKNGTPEEALKRSIAVKPACHELDDGRKQKRHMNSIGG